MRILIVSRDVWTLARQSRRGQLFAKVPMYFVNRLHKLSRIYPLLLIGKTHPRSMKSVYAILGNDVD